MAGARTRERPLKIIWMVGFFLIVVSFAYLLFAPSPVSVEVAVARTGVFRETIRESGILRSKERYTVPAFADGEIKRVTLKVGDSVKAGQKITDLYWEVKYVPLKAPISGIISKVYRESAGPIRRGEPVVEIVDPSQLEVMAELLTTDAVRLNPGAPAWVDNWSGGPPFKAKVTRISKAGFTKPSALGVEEERTEVTANLIDAPKEFLEKAGNAFHVDVTFLVREIPDALIVPSGALFRAGSGWAVYAVKAGRAKECKLEVEAVSGEQAAIRSGLRPGEKVIVYPGDLVKDGSRVKGKL